jgi:hypothetical protein
VESNRALIEFGNKYNKRSRLAVTKWFLVKKVPLKQGKQQDIPEESINRL